MSSELLEHLPSAGLVPKRKLEFTGLETSVLGFGGSVIGNMYDDQCSEEEGVDCVKYALSKGINTFDTAPWYGGGRSEQIIGQGIAGTKREDLVINTKVGRYLNSDVTKIFDFSAQKVTDEFHQSLNRLGLSYVDVVQVHDPEYDLSLKTVLTETLPALQALVNKGLARYIGVTGYPLPIQQKIMELSDVKISTSLVFCHTTLWDQSVHDGFLEFCKARQVDVLGASPMGMGLLTARGAPQWHPASDLLRAKAKQATLFAQQEGVDISRLAVYESVMCSGRDLGTTLVGMNTRKFVDLNIAALQPLTPLESRVFETIKQDFRTLPKEDLVWQSPNWKESNIRSAKAKTETKAEAIHDQ